MGRIYAVTYNGTITNTGGNTDLLSVQPADDKPVRLRGFSLSQTSETGDAAEENVRVTVQVLPATFTVGSGGGAVTPTPTDAGDPACGATVRCNDTTVATTSSTAVTHLDIGWNERATPYDFFWPSAEFCPRTRQGSGLVVRLESTVADDLTACLTFWIEEE